MKVNMRSVIAAFVFLISCLLVNPAQASQRLTVDDGGSYMIKVSANELSRLTVDKGRIEKVWAVNTAWDVRPDKSSGEIFIRPREGIRKAFSFFVKDSFGNTYTLVATPQDIPSETVILTPLKRRDVSVRKADLGEQPYLQQIKTILKDMVGSNYLPYMCDEADTEVPLWQETKIVLTHSCEGSSIQADVYTISNVSGKELVLNEREFKGFGDFVQAVALERLVLQPDEGTRLYIVRGLQ